jgi:hypothetical protein
LADANGGAGAGVDPLAAFAGAHRAALPATRDGKRFNSGEHAWLAGHGAKQACVDLLKTRNISVDDKLFQNIPRARGREEFQYGELVAFSGDFYETPSDLFDEKPSPVSWLWESNDTSDLRALFEKEMKWIEARSRGQGPTAYPEANVRFAWNAKSYVELALRNTDHFGWHNMRAYCHHHAEALKLAVACGRRTDQAFYRALCTNAFADHFLTDGFAAGHIRVPRKEIREWAEKCGLNEKIAGVLSKLLHDQDGHVNLQSLHTGADELRRSEDDGLHVQDSTGESWYTRCDGQLFLEREAKTSKAVRRAVSAVAASVIEFLLAWQRGELPKGVYAATRMVPFPHADAPALITKFPTRLRDAELDQLWAGVGWYAKIPFMPGLEPGHIREIFADLPEIVGRFRENVAADAAASPDLMARLPSEYVAAYRNIA